jgi:hypothetical protein
VYPVRDDDGDIYETVYTVEGNWITEAVEETLPEVLSDVPYLEDELPVTVYNAESRNEYTVLYEEMEELRQEWVGDS